MFYKDGFFNDDINSYDPILSKFINQELIRQQNQIELIAVSYTHLTLPTSSWV